MIGKKLNLKVLTLQEALTAETLIAGNARKNYPAAFKGGLSNSTGKRPEH